MSRVFVETGPTGTQLGVEAVWAQLRAGAVVVGHGPIGTQMAGEYDRPHEYFGFHNAVGTPHGQNLLRQVHDAYVESGAVVVEAGTWGPAPGIITEENLSEIASIKRKEHRIAQEAADAAYGNDSVARAVVDTVRPVLDCYKPTPDGVDIDTYHDLQARAYAEAGSPGVILQTFSSLREIRSAVEAFRRHKVRILGISAYVVSDGPDTGSVSLPGSVDANGVQRKDSLLEVAQIARENDALVGVSCVTPLDGVTAIDMLLNRTDGDLGLYISLNGLSNDPHDPEHAARPHEELAYEAESEDRGNVHVFRGANRAILEHVRAAKLGNPARHIGAVISSCCFSTPARIGEIGKMVDEVFSTGNVLA